MDLAVILGCRGSVPVSGPGYARYGGATSCVFLRLGGQPLILDAGTGLLKLPSVLKPEERELPLLLSHPHADHLLGLPMCPAVLQRGYHFHIWAAPRQGLGPEAQLEALMAPPLWPVGPAALPADFSFHTLTAGITLGNIQAAFMEGCHPGGVTLYRLTGGGHSVAYLPDCNLEGAMLEQAAAFAQDCDLLICDGQYSQAQWPACCGFGHSTWEMAAQLGSLCNARQVRIFHHDPGHTDDCLNAAAAQVARKYPNCTFAFEGEEILL